MAATRAVEVQGKADGVYAEVLTPEALAFVGGLQAEFGARRAELLAHRAERARALAAGEMPDFLPETRSVREGDWQVAPVPADLQTRKVEITGPAERKMIINALNCGASVFMADFEDALTPSWENLVLGQQSLTDAIERSIEFHNPDGRVYRLNDQVATLLVRPRGWHFPEKHVLFEGQPISGSLFDFGLYVYRNGRRLLDKGSGPYFYLPKLESHREARLWNDVFSFAEQELGLPHGSCKGTVLIETVLAAFEMDEILYELRDHSAGLNAGRWDYMFSIIKKFGSRRDFLLADRASVTMTVPFMRAYTELLVKTCHRRGAFAVGGMAAFIPSRRDPKVNEVALAKVHEDKEREAGDGFDGTWVAHPDLVPVAMEEFDRVLGGRANQVQRQRPEVQVQASQLLEVHVPNGVMTEAGLRNNVSVGIQYIESWLRGTGAAAIFNLMEDAATAEISRSQVWSWLHHGVRLEDGQPVTRELIGRLEDEELEKIRATWGNAQYSSGKFPLARQLFEQVALADDFTEFLTLPAYQHID